MKTSKIQRKILNLIRNNSTRQRLIYYIAATLSLSYSSVYSHIQILVAAEYVKKIKSSNSKVYYELTDLGTTSLMETLHEDF